MSSRVFFPNLNQLSKLLMTTLVLICEPGEKMNSELSLVRFLSSRDNLCSQQ